MKSKLLLFTTLIFANALLSQPNLEPSIGIGGLPNDDTPICEIPLYLGNFYETGYQNGETINDFNLYDLNGQEFHIQEILAEGKPVLLVNGSYTCPVFRGKVELINQIVQDFGNAITTCVVYTVEAHPNGDISPYFGFENVTNQNIQLGILYPQPTTYGERKNVVEDMVTGTGLLAPVYIDGPCNEWWEHFGPAPNNSYLIDTNGIVYSKHGWFNKFPDDIICDINELLGNPDSCDDGGVNGQFEFSMTGSNTVIGDAGQTIFVYGTLENTSDEGVEIEVKRMQENVPSGWETSMCIDVCYPTSLDYTTLYLDPGESKTYTMYFYTDSIPGSGMTRMGFRNINNTQNFFLQDMFAETILSTATEMIDNQFEILFFPNPASDFAKLSIAPFLLNQYKNLSIEIIDGKGKRVLTNQIENEIVSLELNSFSKGIYYYLIKSEGLKLAVGKLAIQ